MCQQGLDSAKDAYARSAYVDFEWSDGESSGYGVGNLDGLTCSVCGLDFNSDEMDALGLANDLDPCELYAKTDVPDRLDDYTGPRPITPPPGRARRGMWERFGGPETARAALDDGRS